MPPDAASGASGAKGRIMKGFFNMEGPVFAFLSRLADLFILNILFLICSLPVITIGASLTAMSYVTLKMKDGEEGYIWKSFFRSFRRNFRQATLIWAGMLVMLAVLVTDFLLSRSMGGAMRSVFMVVTFIGMFLWMSVELYVFPLLSRFDNTVKGTLTNSMMIAIGYAPKTILLLAVTAAAVIISFWNGLTMMYAILFWMVLGFAVLSFIYSSVQIGIFRKLMPPDEDAEENTEDAC